MDPKTSQPSSLRKVVISGMIGNGLEWYDYALYGQVAPIISTQFFPSESHFLSMIAVFGVFAAGFIMRPLGAVFFGYLGDKFGRKMSLVTSILMMAIPTALIGFLPNYAQIGIIAPILLTIIRLLQGLSLGGEFSGSITYVVEHAPDNKRALAGGSSLVSMCLGILMGSAVAVCFSSWLSKEDFEQWGWRLPFIIGIAVGLIGLYIRSQLSESPKYTEAKEAGHLSDTPVAEVISKHPKEMVVAMAAYLTVTIPFYTLVIFLISFMKMLGHSMKEALLMNTIDMLVVSAVTPFFCILADKIGRKPVLIAGAASLCLLAYPIFWLLMQPGLLLPMAGHLLFSILLAIYIAPVPALLVEVFPTSVRYTGMALSYNISAAVFGGTVPIVLTWLMKVTGIQTIGAFYLMASTIVTLAILIPFYTESYKSPLHDR